MRVAGPSATFTGRGCGAGTPGHVTAGGCVDTSAFNRLRDDFVKSPRARVAAAVGTVAAALAYVALLGLLYLFVDLLVWKGEVPH